jgi:hypothetical protein
MYSAASVCTILSIRSSRALDLLSARSERNLLHPRAQHILNPFQPRCQFVLSQLIVQGLPYHNLSLDILVPFRKRIQERFFVGTLLFESFTGCTNGFFSSTSRLFASTCITCLSRSFYSLRHDARDVLRRCSLASGWHL